MTNPTFDDVENTVLRTWNRCAVASNLNDDKGPEAAQAYLERFPQKAQKQVMIMLKYIKARGYEETEREVMRGAHG